MSYFPPGSITVGNFPSTIGINNFPATQPVSIAASVPVTGTFYQATQPISGTVTASLSPETTKVIGTVNIAAAQTIDVTGTFWQATQPISGTVTANAGSGTMTVNPGNTANTTAWLVTGTGGTFPVTQSTASSLNATVQGTGAAAARSVGRWRCRAE